LHPHKEVDSVFATKPTIEGVKHKFRSHKIPFDEGIFIPVEDRDSVPKQYRIARSPPTFYSFFKVKIGKHLKVMWIPTEHSTLNAYLLAVELPKKRLVLYTGDFKLNLKENRPPLNVIKALRREYKQILLICETVGVNREGVAGTEDLMIEKLEQSLTGVDFRLILVAIRASEVPRIHCFEKAAIKLNRCIALVEEAMRDTYEAMRQSFPGILVGDYVMFKLSDLKKSNQKIITSTFFLQTPECGTPTTLPSTKY
jgi:mRNA degradation ribonuclease J1/J2